MKSIRLLTLLHLDLVMKPNGKRRQVGTYLCYCGNEFTSDAYTVTSGAVRSCGCYNRKLVTNRNKIHGKSSLRLYTIYHNMKARCNNPKHTNFKDYGGRGIKICKAWNTYLVFEKWALSNGYKENLTLDRRINSQGYKPSNCRWVSKIIQANNRRVAKTVGVRKVAKTWSMRIMINGKSIYKGKFSTEKLARQAYDELLKQKLKTLQ